MAGRSLPNVESTPGPAEYDALSSKMAQMSPGPAYTIQGRAKSAFDVSPFLYAGDTHFFLVHFVRWRDLEEDFGCDVQTLTPAGSR